MSLFAVPEKSTENDIKMLKRTQRIKPTVLCTYVGLLVLCMALGLYKGMTATEGTRAALASALGPGCLILLLFLITSFAETVYFLVPVRYASRDLNELCDSEMLELIGKERAKLSGQNGVAARLLIFSAMFAQGDYAGAKDVLEQVKARRSRDALLNATRVANEAALSLQLKEYDVCEKLLDETEKQLPTIKNEAARGDIAETTAINRDALKIARTETDGVRERMEKRFENSVSHYRQAVLKMNIAQCAQINGDKEAEKDALLFVLKTAPGLAIGRKAQKRLDEMKE